MCPTDFISNGFQISGDDCTVWVNGPDGTCWGRFSMVGIDIHNPGPVQIATGLQCKACTHTTPLIEDWERFRAYFVNLGVYINPLLAPRHLNLQRLVERALCENHDAVMKALEAATESRPMGFLDVKMLRALVSPDALEGSDHELSTVLKALIKRRKGDG